MKAPEMVGETTLTGKNQIGLPAHGVRLLGWERGDRLLVEVIGEDMMVLIRRPKRWSKEFAGRLTDVFGTHEETLRYRAEERRSWEDE